MMMARERSLIVCLLLAVVLSAVQSDSDFSTKLKDALNQAHVSSNQNLSSWDVKPVGSDFDCFPFVHLQEARNVHELTPYDIKIVAALGDSVTAAFGAKACTIIDDLIEFRGVSWSVGGDASLSTVTTIPNIIKKYNPEVVGFSVKTGRPGSPNSHLNRAVSGAIAQDMPDEAKDLVDKMKKMENIDFENDWKLVTLWIGGNNLCAYCNKKEKHSVENYIGGIREALDYLHANLPRTFVNLVQIIDITKLRNTRDSIVCNLVHSAVCSCATDDVTTEMASEYQAAIADLVNTGRYDSTDRDDFTVVVQPFMIGVEVPMKPDNKMDMSYLAPDCFHFSTKGHKEGAVALWNNMIEPVGSKTQGWTPNGPIHCPKEPYYFYTRKNSGNSGFADDNNDTPPDSSHQKQGFSLGTIIAGSVVGIVVIAGIVTVLVILAVLVVRKNRNNRRNGTGESIPLVN